MELNSKGALVEALIDSHARVSRWFEEFPPDDFFKRSESEWSPSDNLDHLVKTIKTITRALGLPKLGLHGMFGKPGRPSRGYEEVCEVYRMEIIKGAQAGGRYLPEQVAPRGHSDRYKQRLMDEWEQAIHGLEQGVEKWSDADLDSYQLPHPILGNLTVREMLFFTIYHNLRHASQEGD